MIYQLAGSRMKPAVLSHGSVDGQGGGLRDGAEVRLNEALIKHAGTGKTRVSFGVRTGSE